MRKFRCLGRMERSLRPGVPAPLAGVILLTLVLFSACAPESSAPAEAGKRQDAEAASDTVERTSLSTTRTDNEGKTTKEPRPEPTSARSAAPRRREPKDHKKQDHDRQNRDRQSHDSKDGKTGRRAEEAGKRGSKQGSGEARSRAVSGLRAEAAGETSPRPWGSCADPLVLVDRQYALSPAYSPLDLVYLSTYGIPAYGGDGLLREEAAANLARLVAAASASGEELVVASAYRSYYDQQSSYANWTSYYGAGAGGVSAPPGHSEHQLGTAIDFTNSAAGYQIGQSFGDTTAAWWLAANAHRYGFVMSYPSGKEEMTGYAWEPWHYRYIGVENAARLQGSGLSLREFLLCEGVRPGCG